MDGKNAFWYNTGMKNILLSAAILSVLASQAAAPEPDVFEEMVFMPDSVKLYTYGVRPPPGVKCPIVIMRSPYVEFKPVDREKFLRNQRTNLARGYAYISQHCRGRGMSQGCWTPYENERADGLALLAWVRKLPWYNGEIFLDGSSYGASVHWSYLDTNPPDVKGAVLLVQEVNRYNIIYRNGFFKSELHGGWFAKLHKQMDPTFRREKPVHLWEFPLRDFSMRCWGETIPSFENQLAHPRADDPFWRSRKPGSGVDYRRALLDSTMPILMRTGFYDIYTEGICDMWRETPTSRLANCSLLIEAYGHNGRIAKEMKGSLGDFPGGARADVGLSSLDWFDFCRTGRPAKAAPPGRVRYYALWENTWTEADALVDGQQKVEIKLGSGSRSWTYDPKRPLPDFPGSGGICFGGMQWQPKPDFRDDVVSYVLPPVGRRLDVRGRMRARLAVRSDCEDSSFYVRVSVKKPDGKWYLLRDDITSIRADGRDYEPGAETFLDFRFADHAFRLDGGDVLRVDVASASKHFAPHGNAKGLQAAVREPKVAHNSVRADASTLTLFALP